MAQPLGAPFVQKASMYPPRQVDPLSAHQYDPKYAVGAAVFDAGQFYRTDTKHQYHRRAPDRQPANQIVELSPEDPSPQ